MTETLGLVRQGFLARGWPVDVVDETLGAFVEAKRRFRRGDLRPQAVEGGRFSEGVLRLMQADATGACTPLSDRRFKAEAVINQLSGETTALDSVRLHIPRAIRLIYDIRNSRDTGHLRDGIDPNLQDASLVVSCMDWVLAEMVRFAHNVPADDAQSIIADIVKKELPVIEMFEGAPVLLKELRPRDHAAALLYWAGDDGAQLSDLRSWTPAGRRKNLRRTLEDLSSELLIHLGESKTKLTARGFRYVEEKRLLEPFETAV